MLIAEPEDRNFWSLLGISTYVQTDIITIKQIYNAIKILSYI